VDDFQNSDAELSEKNCPDSTATNTRTTSASDNKESLFHNNPSQTISTVCDECIPEADEENTTKRINTHEKGEAKEASHVDESHEETTTTTSSESESSLDESDIKGLDEAAFKLNRQRWKFYRRAQHANKMRTRRPRYFSLNMASADQSLLRYDSGHETENEKKSAETEPEKNEERIGLCLSNLELKKRQLEDKYKTHNPRGPLAATNYLLNKNIPHTCVIKNKTRSSSSSCIHCISHGNEESQLSAKIIKNSKKRNSLFGSMGVNNLLFSLPR